MLAAIDGGIPLTGRSEFEDALSLRGLAKSLAVVIPGNAKVGSYSDTLTFTSAPLA